MATHSSTLAWRIPWTEEPGGLQSMGSQSQTRLKWQSTHVRAYFCDFPLWLPIGLWTLVSSHHCYTLFSSFTYRPYCRKTFLWFAIFYHHEQCFFFRSWYPNTSVYLGFELKSTISGPCACSILLLLLLLNRFTRRCQTIGGYSSKIEQAHGPEIVLLSSNPR